jgi:hypothetical protein
MGEIFGSDFVENRVCEANLWTQVSADILPNILFYPLSSFFTMFDMILLTESFDNERLFDIFMLTSDERAIAENTGDIF